MSEDEPIPQYWLILYSSKATNSGTEITLNEVIVGHPADWLARTLGAHPSTVLRGAMPIDATQFEKLAAKL